MEKDKFKVIKGGGNRLPKPKYRYIKGYATNTRLMGVIGVQLFWKTEEGYEYVQFFHLDYEEYGIDGFESLTNARYDEINIVTNKMMGGLGGKFVRISEREGIYLIKESYKINEKYNQHLPGLIEEYEYLLERDISLTKQEEQELWYKICEPIDNDIQLINYFLMRAIGADGTGKEFLSLKDTTGFKPVNKSYTLIKNVVEVSHSKDGVNYYNSESVIDLDKGYQLIISEIAVKDTDMGPRVVSAEVKSKMRISTIEAAFQLKKPEYVLIYSLNDFIEFIEIFDGEKPGAMQNIHQAGFLYTEFNPNNDHVKQPIYYLNGDIYAVYYVTTGNQLAVAAYKEENLKDIKAYFNVEEFKEIMEFESEFKIDNPILYEFVQSGYDNFYQFINDENS